MGLLLRAYTGNGPLTERCNALFESLQARCRAAGHPVITVSMGISISRKEDDYTSLYQRADAVLYEIKKSGKNSYRIEAEAHRDSYPGMEQEHHTVQ